MSAATRQRDAFLGGEGDAYADRNRSAGASVDLLSQLAPYLSAGAAVLEIGCGAGQNLVALEALAPGIRCFEIDPSPKAIERGRSRAPHHHLEVGTADFIPFGGPFDLVFFGFCLYLCDRALLHKAVDQADAVLRGGHADETGILAIVDFDPCQLHRRAYRHDPHLPSYKMDYSALFLADPAYRLDSKSAFDASRGTVGRAKVEENRVALWILEKNVTAAYPSQL